MLAPEVIIITLSGCQSGDERVSCARVASIRTKEENDKVEPLKRKPLKKSRLLFQSSENHAYPSLLTKCEMSFCGADWAVISLVKNSRFISFIRP